jgi:hypothetical protein
VLTDDVDAEPGPGLFIDGTWSLVCRSCVEKPAPDTVKALDELRKVEEKKREEAKETEIKETLLKEYVERRPIPYIVYDGINERIGQGHTLADFDGFALLLKPGLPEKAVIDALLSVADEICKSGVRAWREGETSPPFDPDELPF